MTKYDKPESVGANDFGLALHLINSDAVGEIMQYGTYGTPSLKLVCEWDDEVATFPTADEDECSSSCSKLGSRS